MARGSTSPREWQLQLLVRARGVITAVLAITGVLVAIASRSAELRWYAVALLVASTVVWFGARASHRWRARA